MNVSPKTQNGICLRMVGNYIFGLKYILAVKGTQRDPIKLIAF